MCDRAPFRKFNSVWSFIAAFPPPWLPPQPGYSCCWLSGRVIVELSITITLVNRSRIGARAFSEPTTTFLVVSQNSVFKNSTSLGECRWSIAWEVTSTPHCTAICAKSSADAFGFCKYPRTNVFASDMPSNFRFRTMTRVVLAAASAILPKSSCNALPTLVIIPMGSSFFQITGLVVNGDFERTSQFLKYQ